MYTCLLLTLTNLSPSKLSKVHLRTNFKALKFMRRIIINPREMCRNMRIYTMQLCLKTKTS